MKEGEGPSRAGALLLSCVLVALALPAAAGAASPPGPWDGTNPFRCTIQDAGRGTAVPDPGADPYCVNFDKTNQNITELGLVQFLSLEPARVAAASPKCFYFQQDHWRGSLVQSDGSTVLYEFYGHYFFDKATGDGGVWVRDFSLHGQTFDPAELPGFPPSYGQYYGPGTGGMISHDQVPADPNCAARASANAAAIYASKGNVPRCLAAHGRVNRRGVGTVQLHTREDRVRTALGPPREVKRGFLRYCVAGGGSLLVGQPSDRSGSLGTNGHAPTVMVLTTSRDFRLTGRHRRPVGVGARLRVLKRALAGWHPIGRVGGVSWRRRGDLLAGLRHGRIAYLGVYDRGRIHKLRTLRGYLTRAL